MSSKHLKYINMILVFNKEGKMIDIKRYMKDVCSAYGLSYKSVRNKKWNNKGMKAHKGYTFVRVYNDVYGGYKGIEITIKQ